MRALVFSTRRVRSAALAANRRPVARFASVREQQKIWNSKMVPWSMALLPGFNGSGLMVGVMAWQQVIVSFRKDTCQTPTLPCRTLLGPVMSSNSIGLL